MCVLCECAWYVCVYVCAHLKAVLKDINLKLWFHDRQTCLLSNSIAKCVTISIVYRLTGTHHIRTFVCKLIHTH